jgi:hypothetical protein
LLAADRNVVSVGVEHTDDVSENRRDGTTVREQDKATIRSVDPLTDNSVALWKTLGTWASEVAEDPALLDTCEFHLVTNGVITQEGLASRLHAATTPETIAEATEALLGHVEELRDDLKPFGEVLAALGEKSVARLVEHIFVCDATSAHYSGALEDVPALRLLAPHARRMVFDGAVAFVKRTVLERAVANEPSVVDRADFDREMRALVRHVQVAPLAIAINPKAAPSEGELSAARSLGFVRQLDWVESEPDFIRECYIHYTQARAARLSWTESGDVSEAALSAYEDELRLRWRLIVRKEKRTAFASAVQQGQHRLDETLSEDTALAGEPLPKAITCGNLHALADFAEGAAPEIGWHPDFLDLAKDSKPKP